jgi:hypothetical protein
MILESVFGIKLFSMSRRTQPRHFPLRGVASIGTGG